MSLGKGLSLYQRQHKQRILAAIQSITRLVSETVCMATMVATDYLIGKLNDDHAVPWLLGAGVQNFFNQAIQAVTSLNGSTQPRIASDTSDEAKQCKAEMDAIRRQLFGTDFACPARDGLSDILSSQSRRMTTNMHNLYVTTFHKRQRRAVTMAVDIWCKSPEAMELLPKELKQRAQLRNQLVNYTLSEINGMAFCPRTVLITNQMKEALQPLVDSHLASLAPFRCFLRVYDNLHAQTTAPKALIQMSAFYAVDVVHRHPAEVPAKVAASSELKQLVAAAIRRESPGADVSQVLSATAEGKKSRGRPAKETQPKKRHCEDSGDLEPDEKKRKTDQVAATPTAAGREPIHPKRFADCLHLILPYFHFLWRTVESRRSFPVCPQLQRKVHHIDISALGLLELINLVDAVPGQRRRKKRSKKNEEAKEDKAWTLQRHLGLTDAQMNGKYFTEHGAQLLQRLFHYPRGRRSADFHYIAPAVTNGRQLWLHYSLGEPRRAKRRASKSKKRKRDDETKPMLDIQTTSRGVYRYEEDVLIDPEALARCGKFGISVDPGHVNIIAARRPFDPPDYQAEEERAWSEAAAAGLDYIPNRSRRRLAKLRKQNEANESIYLLSNAQYHQMTRMTEAARKRRGWRALDELLDIDKRLSERGVRHRTFDREEYRRYCRIVVDNWQQLFDHAFKPKQTKLRFDVYQAKQSAFHKVALALAGSKSLGECYLIWGSGMFPPTSRGYESAPNKGMYRGLSQFMPVIISNERGSSKHSCCCNQPVTRPKKREYYCTRDDHKEDNGAMESPDIRGDVRGLSICPCGKWWSRDVASAIYIGEAFRRHVQTGMWMFPAADGDDDA